MLNIQFKSNPKRLLIRGIVSVIVGGAIIAVPNLTANVVMQILGALLIADGIIAFLIEYFKKEKQPANPWVLIPRGILSVIVGAILVIFPSFLINIFVFVLGIVLFMAGFSLLTTQLNARKIGISWIMVILSVIAIVSGIVLIASPFESTNNLLIFFGVIMFLYGIGEIVWSFKLRKIQKEEIKNNPPQIVDADYEEVDEK
ncbi:MAG: DUF308 domain-containing protein [Prolixibacteraceae bacterium]|jgi:uncharacterized membrane protein HdeD (DUF308 family)|nr:DUF308 domain-containing protein [Prolixibacteraceae bacterium]